MVEKISPQALAARLREALESSTKSQKDLADLFVISEAAVSKWLRSGKIGRDRLPILARFLDISLIWFLSGEGPMREPTIEYITADERRLLEKYRAMDEEGKKAAQVILDRSGGGFTRLPAEENPVLSQLGPPLLEDQRHIA